MRGGRLFFTVPTSAPAFNSTLGSTQTLYALVASTVGRKWDGPNHRSVRLVNPTSSVPVYVEFGSSLAEASTNSILITPRRPHIFQTMSISHVSFLSTADVIINISLGYGGETDAVIPVQSISIPATSTSTSTAVFMFTVSQAGSIMHVNWLESSAAFSPGDAAHLQWQYDYTSTSTGTSTSTSTAALAFTISQVGSILHVNWLESSSGFTPGDAAHLLWQYDYTSTSTGASTSTSTSPYAFTVSQAGSVLHVNWLESSSGFSPGDAAHILWQYDYTSTSTST